MAKNNDGPRGYHDDPLVRKKTPPVNVWVNLAAAYPIPRTPGTYVKGGLDLTASVPARLHSWAVTTSGHWVGWITYEHRSMNGVTGWVVAAAIQPRFDQPARKDGGNTTSSSG